MEDERAADSPPDSERLRLLNQRSDWAFAVLGEVLTAYERQEPCWFGLTVLDLLRGALDNLRHYLENPGATEVTWADPWVELRLPAGAWAGGAAPKLEEGTFTEADFAEWPAGTEAQPASDGRQALRTMPEVVRDKLSALSAVHTRNHVLQELTNAVVCEKRGNSFSPVLPGPLLDEVHALPPDERDEAVAALFEPFVLGAEVLSEEDLALGDAQDAEEDGLPNPLDGPAVAAFIGRVLLGFTATVTLEDTRFAVRPVFEFYPLVADCDTGEAHWPIVVGLQIVGPDGEPADPSREWPAEGVREFAETVWGCLSEPLALVENWLRQEGERIRPVLEAQEPLWQWEDDGYPGAEKAHDVPGSQVRLSEEWAAAFADEDSILCVRPGQAAELLARYLGQNVSPVTIRRWVAKGKLPGTVIKRGSRQVHLAALTPLLLRRIDTHFEAEDARDWQQEVCDLRKRYGSAGALAHKLGRHPRTVRKWLSGEQEPSPEAQEVLKWIMDRGGA